MAFCLAALHFTSIPVRLFVNVSLLLSSLMPFFPETQLSRFYSTHLGWNFPRGLHCKSCSCVTAAIPKLWAKLLITHRLRHIEPDHGFNTGTFPFKGSDDPSLLLWNIRNCIMMYVRHTLFGQAVSDTFWNQTQLQSTHACRHLLSSFVILRHVGKAGKKDSGLTMK